MFKLQSKRKVKTSAKHMESGADCSEKVLPVKLAAPGT